MAREAEREAEREARHRLAHRCLEAAHWKAERVAERFLAEREAERKTKREAEREAERAVESAVESVWKALEREAEREAERKTKREAEREAERAVESAVESGAERGAEREAERAVESAVESEAEREAERARIMSTEFNSEAEFCGKLAESALPVEREAGLPTLLIELAGCYKALASDDSNAAMRKRCADLRIRLTVCHPWVKVGKGRPAHVSAVHPGHHMTVYNCSVDPKKFGQWWRAQGRSMRDIKGGDDQVYASSALLRAFLPEASPRCGSQGAQPPTPLGQPTPQRKSRGRSISTLSLRRWRTATCRGSCWSVCGSLSASRSTTKTRTRTRKWWLRRRLDAIRAGGTVRRLRHSL